MATPPFFGDGIESGAQRGADAGKICSAQILYHLRHREARRLEFLLQHLHVLQKAYLLTPASFAAWQHRHIFVVPPALQVKGYHEGTTEGQRKDNTWPARAPDRRGGMGARQRVGCFALSGASRIRSVSGLAALIAPDEIDTKFSTMSPHLGTSRASVSRSVATERVGGVDTLWRCSVRAQSAA